MNTGFCDRHQYPYGAEDTSGPICPWCERLRVERLEVEVKDLLETRGDLERQLTEICTAGLAPAPGSVSLTYAELETLLQNCRWGIQSAPGEDPPAGYEALPPEQAEIADACWYRGMEQLSTALLNYWYDHGARDPRTAKGN